MLRFKSFCVNKFVKEDVELGALTAAELADAREAIFLFVQMEAFSD